MSDENGDNRAASKPTEADVSRWRSQLDGLAQRRGEQGRTPRPAAQEILPPETDRRAKLRELLRNRQDRDEQGAGERFRRGAGGKEEGDLRDQLVRRALQNRPNRRGEGDQAEVGDGRLLRRLREAGEGGGLRGGPSRTGSENNEPSTQSYSKEPSMSDDGRGNENRPLGVADIPGAIPPDGARQGGGTTAGGGPDRAKVAEFLRRRGGLGGGGEGAPRQGMQGGGMLQGRRGGEASSDPVVRGRELLDRLKSRLNEPGEEGGQNQRFAAGINLIDQGYTKLEQDVERLKSELADAEEKLQVLLDQD